MEEISNEKPQKYSLVTGEKIKNKSVKKLKKQHKVKDKKESIDEKKFNKRKKKIIRKLTKKSKGENNKTQLKQDEKAEEVLIIRKAEQGKPKSFGRKFMNLLSYALVGIVAVFFGYASGNFYVANVLNKVDYSAFSEESLRDDNMAIYQTIISSNKAIETQDAGELFMAAEYLLNNQENYYSNTVGAIQPSIGSTQSIWGYKKKAGNIIEGENASKGMMSLAEYYSYDLTTKTASIYKATKVSTGSVTYPSDPTWIMNYEDYRAEYGTAPDAPVVPYIISSKTILEGTSKVENIGGGKYKLTFSLTTDSSVINYIKQVKHMSGLADYPVFKQINVTSIIDKNLKFSTVRYDEAYTVMYFGVMATCSGFVENTITY